MTVERLQSVHGAEDVGVERRYRSGDQLVDEDLIHDLLRRRRRLPPAAERVLGLGYRLEAPTVALEREAERRHVDRHRLQASLEHQRPWHARVVLEVTLEEPVIGTQRQPCSQVAPLPWTAARIERRHLVEK